MKKDQWLNVFSGKNQQEEFAEFFIDEKVQKQLNVYEVLDQILNLPIRDNSNSGEKPLKTFYNAYFINRIIEKVNATEDFFNLKLPLIEIKLKRKYTKEEFKVEEIQSVDQLQKNDYDAHTDYLEFLRQKYSLEGQDENDAESGNESEAEFGTPGQFEQLGTPGEFLERVNEVVSQAPKGTITDRILNPGKRAKNALEKADREAANLAVMKKFQLRTDKFKFDNFSTFLEHLKNNYGGKSYPDKYDAFANAIIKKYHCPLRYQGNYINRRIR